jgi:hypothetical protein
MLKSNTTVFIASYLSFFRVFLLDQDAGPGTLSGKMSGKMSNEACIKGRTVS